jgi:hypothetical protein
MFMSVGVGVGLGVGTSRAQPLVRERVSPPFATARPPRAASRARHGVAFGAVVGTVGFLIAYTTLQLLHARGADPAAVVALARIPLFARFLASSVCGIAVGGVALIARPRTGAMLRHLPALFTAAIVLFVTVVVLFP